MTATEYSINETAPAKSTGGVELLQGDCLELLADVADGSVDAVFCDLPYAVTDCEWDVILPFETLWPIYRRVVKPGGAIVLTAIDPFSAYLVWHGRKQFRQTLIWVKSNHSDFVNANRRHLPIHENVHLFAFDKAPVYHPQMGRGAAYVNKRKAAPREVMWNGKMVKKTGPTVCLDGARYPQTTLYFDCQKEGLHPTQKPVALFEYLIRTFSDPGDLILDHCMGSGTTGVAAVRAGRRFLGMERDPAYFETCCRRIGEAQDALSGSLFGADTPALFDRRFETVPMFEEDEAQPVPAV